MSSKSSIDKYEPLKVDTTTLKIEIKTNGDLVTKEYDLIPFHPNMSDMKDLSNNNYILFPSFVKITMKYLKNAGVGQDYRKVFTQLDKYILLIKYMTKTDKDILEDYTLLVDQSQYKNYAMSFVQDFTTDITRDFRAVQKYEPLTDQEIVTNNIGIIKSIFLPNNGRFFVLGHEYIINECRYLSPYEESTTVNQKISSEKKKIPLNYTIKIEMQLLDVALNPGVGDFSKLSCKQKKISLNKDVKEIFGESFGYKEEIKAILPPLNPTTTTAKRGFGKLQTEWEERNKYIKAPTTEKERLEQEQKMTKLQKRMAQFDKSNEEYNKIPPLWMKESKDLVDKYAAFVKEIEGYKKEISNIKEANKPYDPATKQPSFVYDLIKAVEDKMREATGQLVTDDIAKDETVKTHYKNDVEAYKIKMKAENKMVPVSESAVLREAIVDKFMTNVDSMLNVDNITYLNAIKDSETRTINNKYTEPFLTDLRAKEKDVKVLQDENDKLSKEIQAMDNSDYNKKARIQDLSKLQATLLKKKTDLKSLQDKFGVNGEKLIATWTAAENKMNSLKSGIELDKNIGEQKILNASVTKELQDKLKEIKELKETLYKAYYFSGQYSEITREEGEKYSKKPGDRPIETVDLLEGNIIQLKEDYLEIAKKVSMFNKMQSYITLLNEEMERIKVLKKGKESEKDKKDKEIKSKSSELESISKGHISEEQTRENIQKEIDKAEKALKDFDPAAIPPPPTDEDKLKDVLNKANKKLKDFNDGLKGTQDREVSLKGERDKIQAKIAPLIKKIDALKIYEAIYNKKITDLKKIAEKDIKDTDFLTSIDEMKSARDTYKAKIVSIDNETNIALIKTGGKNTTKRIVRRVKKWSKKKYLNNKSSKHKKGNKRSRQQKRLKRKQKRKFTKRRS